MNLVDPNSKLCVSGGNEALFHNDVTRDTTNMVVCLRSIHPCFSLTDLHKFTNRIESKVMLINGVPITCISQAAIRYHMPITMIISVLEVENGKIGDANKNKNGTIDYGPMQINSVWLKRIKQFGYSTHDLQYNPCVNVNVGTWILAQKIANDKAVWQGIGDYHSRSYDQNLYYQYKVNVFYDFIVKELYTGE